MLWTYIPATALNIGLNLYAVPHYGMYGAAWTGLICQGATVIGGWFIGASLFPVWLPPAQVVRCILAVLPMAVGLSVVRFPANWWGLFGAILLGAGLYVLSAALLDVGETRTLGLRRLRKRTIRKLPVFSD